MLSSDLRAVYKSYQNIYEEGDGISCEMIEEVVEELIEECLEFGYSIDEAITAVENAAILYIDEAKVTYGSDTESPEQRRERAKAKVGQKKVEARKTAVKTAVGRAKAKATGAIAGAGIAASIAKDTARRATRTVAHKVSYGVQKKKAEVKSGVKGLIGKGLRKAAGAVGKVAQKAASAASKLGEEKESQIDTWDIILEFLISEGHADTNEEAIAIMANMDKEMIQSIIETRMDPRGRPASGPMNVYAKNKPNTDPKFQAALKAVRDADAKKTPEQRKKELDAYKARKENS